MAKGEHAQHILMGVVKNRKVNESTEPDAEKFVHTIVLTRNAFKRPERESRYNYGKGLPLQPAFSHSLHGTRVRSPIHNLSERHISRSLFAP